MLSRAAERIYWAGRYLERAENTARIVQQYSQLLLDLPEEVGVEWSELVAIFGAAQSFEQAGAGGDERHILAFLLADPGSSTSLLYAISMARDNIRNSRDLLPQESWESANELFQYARRELVSHDDRRKRVRGAVRLHRAMPADQRHTHGHHEPRQPAITFCH